MSGVTVITSGKGGVGKSTVSVGLARAMAERGRRVLLVDCDAGLRSLDRLTGIDQRLVYDISDIAAGRCAPIDAIYASDTFPGIFLLPAPASGDDMVGEAIMKKLVPVLGKYYDDVILDSPAGIGRGFRAAAAAADRAILVCNPEPVCVRSCTAASAQLKAMGIKEQRLVINRFNGKSFRQIKAIDDLDQIIDETGLRLLGVIPEDFDMVGAFLGDEVASSKGMLAVKRIAGRLEGERIPVIL